MPRQFRARPLADALAKSTSRIPTRTAKGWDQPSLDAWLDQLDAAIQENERPALLVAHSLSVSLVVHWADRFHGAVAGALLVAPSDVEAPSYPTGTTGFAPLPLRKLGFPAMVVASSNGPLVSPARAEQFTHAWGAELVAAGDYGHLGSDAKLAQWPFGAALLEKLAAKANLALPA